MCMKLLPCCFLLAVEGMEPEEKLDWSRQDGRGKVAELAGRDLTPAGRLLSLLFDQNPVGL